MTSSNTLRRHQIIIRATQPPYNYPSKEQIIQKLQEADFDSLSVSSFKRDLSAIRVYGIEIKHKKRHNGYYIDMPQDEDLSDFNTFIALLERRERTEFLTHTIKSVREVGRYLQLEKNPNFTGNQHLPLIWDALRRPCAITFNYLSYGGIAPQPRHVEPNLLFEYKNRFYLDAWDLDKQQIRTFGLDRMTDLALASHSTQKLNSPQSATLRRHVIGVNYASEAQPVRVVLRLTNLQANYLHSLPLHQSQQTIAQTPTHTDFELNVVLNTELEIEILGMGEAVEVLEPTELRQKIKTRITACYQKYQ